MKKILIFLIAIILFSSNSFAAMPDTLTDREYQKFTTDSDGNPAIRIIGSGAYPYSGFQSDTSSGTLPDVPTNLTFKVDYTANNKANADADSGSGSLTATVASTRSASAPASYNTIAGVVTTTTTSNTPLITQGFYNEYSFIPAPGLLMEESKANRATYSYTLSNAAWIASNITVADNSVGSPDGNTNADTLTATAANATLTQTYTVASNPYTSSIFLKRKTGTSPIYISVNNGTTKVPCNVTDTLNWVRCSATGTNANPTIQVIIEASGDAVYAWQGQIEAGYVMTSPILNATTVNTRPAIRVQYATAGNMTTTGQTIFIKYVPFWGGGDSTVAHTLLATDTTGGKDNQVIQLNATNDTMQFYPNITDDDAGTVTGIGNIDKFKPQIIAASFTASSPSKNIYVDGLLDASDLSTAITTPDYGTTFYIGSSNTASTQINGIIQEVRIYSGELTQAQVFAVSQDMGLKKKIHILPFGDSITFAGGGAGGEDNWSYRKAIQENLGDKYLMVGNKSSPTWDPAPVFWKKRSTRGAGVAGETTSQILTRVPANLSQYFVSGTYLRGSAVTIQAGFNDITLDPETDAALSITAAITNIKSMIDLVDAADPEINVFVGKLTPRYDTSAFLGEVQRFNEELAKTRIGWTKKNVYIVDNFSDLFRDPDWKAKYMYDDKHPKAEGFQILGRNYANAIKDLKNPVTPLKRYYAAYSAGTVYALTNASALVDFGTTDPSLLIDNPGVYLVRGGVQLKYNAATFAANQTATCKIRRINNTAADLTGATSTVDLAILGSETTDNAGYIQIPETEYKTFNTNDILQVYCTVSAVPGAGSLQAVSAFITASER